MWVSLAWHSCQHLWFYSGFCYSLNGAYCRFLSVPFSMFRNSGLFTVPSKSALILLKKKKIPVSVWCWIKRFHWIFHYNERLMFPIYHNDRHDLNLWMRLSLFLFSSPSDLTGCLLIHLIPARSLNASDSPTPFSSFRQALTSSNTSFCSLLFLQI